MDQERWATAGPAAAITLYYMALADAAFFTHLARELEVSRGRDLTSYGTVLLSLAEP
ncbi:MAG TPA: hypothetical protein VIV12_20290 [Streptosporangiaceae bacterium]